MLERSALVAEDRGVDDDAAGPRSFAKYSASGPVSASLLDDDNDKLEDDDDDDVCSDWTIESGDIPAFSSLSSKSIL